MIPLTINDATLVLLGVFWIACGIWGAGLVFAYFQREYKLIRYRSFYDNQKDAILALMLGPIVLVVLYSLRFTTNGWLWPWSKKAKQEAGIEV